MVVLHGLYCWLTLQWWIWLGGLAFCLFKETCQTRCIITTSVLKLIPTCINLIWAFIGEKKTLRIIVHMENSLENKLTEGWPSMNCFYPLKDCIIRDILVFFKWLWHFLKHYGILGLSFITIERVLITRKIILFFYFVSVCNDACSQNLQWLSLHDVYEPNHGAVHLELIQCSMLIICQ